MWDFLTHPSNLIFSVCICLMLFIGLLEIVLLVLGGGSQGMLEQFLPEDAHQPDLAPIDQPAALTQFLEWLYLGRIPLLVWLIIFLTLYGLTGLIIQTIFYHVRLHLLSAWVLAPVCLLLSMPLVRYGSMFIAKILPQDETTAIYSDDLIGRTAIIILGEAKVNSPAQAKLRDQFGQMHYILVEPEQESIFKPGQAVILTQRTHNGFRAISS